MVKTPEDFKRSVCSIYFETVSYNITGCLRISVEKQDDMISVNVGLPWSGTRTITQKRWDAMLSKLFDDCKILDWKRKNEPEGFYMTDGTSWVLKVRPAEGRTRIWRGYNAFPPQWDNMEKMFRRLAVKDGNHNGK